MRNLSAVAILLAGLCADAWGRDCTKADAVTAETKAAYLKSWAEIYESYKRYGHCDDGAIAEGFTESVTVLLAKGWSKLPELTARISQDERFRTFVLRHVNASADEQNLKLIATNARRRCPEEDKPLCQAIVERADTRQ